MNNNFMVDLTGRIQKGIGDMPTMQKWSKIEAEEIQPESFKSMLTGLSHGINSDLNAPDTMLKKQMAGDSSVDIHDVMTAMAKAELTVSVATQVTSKVIQAYDKIMQISV